MEVQEKNSESEIYENLKNKIRDSDRIKSQFERFNLYKDDVMKVVKRIESEYDVNIFFLAELGSRALGIDVEDSDFDLSGFFVPNNELEYFKIIRKFEKSIKISQEKIVVQNRIYEIDIDLWDIKDWLGAKVTRNIASCDYWFASELIYVNKYPDITNAIKQYINPPYLLYWGKAKSGIGYNLKDIKNKGECLNKSLMNVLTSLFQYAHCQIFQNFPKYNILEEIEFLLENKVKIIEGGLFDQEDFKIIEKNIELYIELFESKKQTRKSTSKSISPWIEKFMRLLEGKYNTHKKKCELENLMKEEMAQEWFDKLLSVKNI